MPPYTKSLTIRIGRDWRPVAFPLAFLAQYIRRKPCILPSKFQFTNRKILSISNGDPTFEFLKWGHPIPR